MIITYGRSSSLGSAWSMCQMNYYIQYNLGFSFESGLKTNAGTIAHAVLEICAKTKKAKDEGLPFIDDEIGGRLATKYFDINKLILDVYNYYTKGNGIYAHQNWTDFMFNHIKNCVWNCITFNNGEFSPRKRKIKAIEQEFKIDLTESWAKYKYTLFDGTILEGNYFLRGTIDLVTEVGPNSYEIIDFKTGSSKDYASNNFKQKDYDYFKKDLQLRLYHWVINRLYNADNVLVTIFYLSKNEIGPQTIDFTKKDLVKTEKMLKERFEEISKTTVPQQNFGKRCKTFCPYGKEIYKLEGIEPIIAKEDSPNTLTKKNQPLSMCDFTKKIIDDYGIEYATHYLKNPKHDFNFYSAPGGGTKETK